MSPTNNRSEQTGHSPYHELYYFDLENEEYLSLEQAAEILRERARLLAAAPAEATGDTVDALLFRLGEERYGLEIGHVLEIYPLEQITPVPRTPDFIVGVFNARGRLNAVIDLRPFLNLPAAPATPQSKIILTAVEQEQTIEAGILADEVVDVITLFRAKLDPVSVTHAGAKSEFIQGITPDMLQLIDLPALLTDKRLIIQEDL